jgi:hypothetical protein
MTATLSVDHAMGSPGAGLVDVAQAHDPNKETAINAQEVRWSMGYMIATSCG